MKTTILVLCVLTATAAFGQGLIGGTSLSITANPLQFPTHQQRALQHTLGDTQSILETYNFASAQGTRPLWEFAPKDESMPLGDVARMFRKEHESAPKATFVWEKQ